MKSDTRVTKEFKYLIPKFNNLEVFENEDDFYMQIAMDRLDKYNSWENREKEKYYKSKEKTIEDIELDINPSGCIKCEQYKPVPLLKKVVNSIELSNKSRYVTTV